MWGVIYSDGGRSDRGRRVHLAVTVGARPLFYSPAIRDEVDPFIGTAATCLPPPSGLAATWWWPKPQVGNTHPGATSPLGMVSACAFSGAYPTGYGRYSKNTEGVPDEMFEVAQASGFTHFQQSGTGAIRKYYNYVRVTPMVGPLDDLGQSWTLNDETASPGYYAATLDTGVHCEITVGEKVAVHRYTFPETRSARVVLDLSCGGLAIEHGRTVPLRAHVESMGYGRAQGTVVMEGVLDRETAAREVEHDARAARLRERVAVDGHLLAHGDLAVHPGVEGGRVVAGHGRLVVQRPRLAEVVERRHHGGDPHVVVVLADRAGARLLEVREPGRLRRLEHLVGHAFGVLAVAAVAGGVGTGERAGRHHAER